MKVKIDQQYSCGVVQLSYLHKEYERRAGEEFSWEQKKIPHLDTLKKALTKYVVGKYRCSIKYIPARNIFMWSDNDDYVNGEDLADEIESKKGFGKVHRSRWVRNPNTDNQIRSYTWMPTLKAHKWIGWSPERNNLW